MNYLCPFSGLLTPRRFCSVAILLALVLPTSNLFAQAGARRQQTRPRVQMPRRAAAPVPGNPVASQSVERAIQTSAELQRYHFRIEQQPALVTIEGDVDAATKTLYLKMTLGAGGIPPAELWIRNGQAYGKHAYLNRYFKIKGMAGFPDYLQSAAAMAKLKERSAWREDAGVLKLDFPVDVSATSQRVEQRLDTWLRSARHKDRHTFLEQALTGLKGLTATAQIHVVKNGSMISRLVLQAQSASGRRSSTIFSFSPVTTSRPLPAQALRATREVPPGALFYRLRTIQGWCRATHRFFGLQSINLVKSEDPAGYYNEIYSNGNLDIDKQQDTTFNPLIIGVDYEDVEDGEDLATAHRIYAAWLPNPQAYLLTGLTRDYRHFGGDGEGLEDSWLFDLRSGESDPDGDGRYYSARDWGWNAPGKNGMTFREAIAQYGKGTINGRKAAYAMLGHIVHLLQDQAMPDHAALIAHPGSSSTDPDIYEEIPLCDLLAAEIMAGSCAPMCGIDVFCYPVCALEMTAAAASSKAACEAGIDPDERGYEKVVLDSYPKHYADNNIGARVAQIGSVVLPDYNAYFHEVCELAKREPGLRGLTQPLGVGGHPATAVVDYPVDPYIHDSSASEKRPYLELTDAVGTVAITRGAGLMKHFFQIVNPPPAVSSLTIRQNNEIRFQVKWNVKADGGGQPYREAARINKPLYPGIEAALELQFGPAIGPFYREMDTLAVTLDGQALTMAHKVNGYSHSYQATYLPPCTGAGTKTMQLAIGGADKSPHFNGRQQQVRGNLLDRDPATYARAASDPPYAFSGYEQGGTYNETITVGAPQACWKDVTETYFCNKASHFDWWQGYKGKGLEARLKILEQGTENAPVVSASCGRYRLSLAPTVKFLKKGPTPAASGPKAPVPLNMWVEGPPSQFGLTITLDDPYSMAPKILITHNQESTGIADQEELEFRVPVTLTFEPTSGPAKEMCRVEQELRILGIGHYWKSVNDCIIHSTNWQRWVGPWEEVEVGPEVSRSIDLSKAIHSGTIAEAERVASHFARLQAAGGREVLFISPDRQSTMETSLQAAGLAVTRTNDPKIVSVKASARTQAGTYVIPFSAGQAAAPETVLVIKVTK